MVLVVAGKLIEIWIFKFYLFYFYLGSADLVSHPFPTTGLQILHSIYIVYISRTKPQGL